MNPITIDDFPAYFQELHGHPPYDWQRRLAEKASSGLWPDCIDLPTGSGKTACLDIAIFALACQAALPVEDRTAPRRIFFCVNRRVIVDEAHQRAKRIARAIWNADRNAAGSKPTLQHVAAALRAISGISEREIPPLDVLELRGGIYRDNRWARSATQPTIVCTTIDQLGSRLLFRGYGVSSGAAPIQAALIAYDSLVLLDEAHISRPFLQTLQQTKRYLDPVKWAAQDIGMKRMIVVPMTATPPEGTHDTTVIRLEDKDRQNEGLTKRLMAGKLAMLKSAPNVVDAAVADAKGLTSDAPTAVGIIVNRVATAKEIYKKLREANKDKPEVIVELVIGSMRPVDRDQQAGRLRELVGPERPKVTGQTSFVVATQCLEVGADYDFDALVTECASLDALRQRFGRLNRGGRDIDARAVVLIDQKQAKDNEKLDDDKPLDPIYGNSLSRTWNWLWEHAKVTTAENEPTDFEEAPPKKRKRKPAPTAIEVHSVDFGIDAFNEFLNEHGEDGRIPDALLSPSTKLNPPIMLPAYVDLWCQTSPQPCPDPDVSLFIHGLQEGARDVQVCWRADLVDDGTMTRDHWCDVVSLLPPTSAECMSVPISRLRRWLATPDDAAADQSDLLTVAEAEGEEAPASRGAKRPSISRTPYVLWKGSRDSKLLVSTNGLYPGCTVVLPVSAAGWNELGHVPDLLTPAPLKEASTGDPSVEPFVTEQPDGKPFGDITTPIDVAETAFLLAKDRAALRLHPTLKSRLPNIPETTSLFSRIADAEDPPTLSEIRSLLNAVANELESLPITDGRGALLRALADPQNGLEQEPYPDGCGIVFKTRKRLGSDTNRHLPEVPALDDGDDAPSRSQRKIPVPLDDHTRHVSLEMKSSLQVLPLDAFKSDFSTAVTLHDWGKADERFQALLRGADRTDAWLWVGATAALLAKSHGLPQSRREREAARIRAGLPKNFRHEMLSVQLAERSEQLPNDFQQRDLILHLIAAHHGYARPFAPVVLDEEFPEVTVCGITLTSDQRQTCPPHRLDSGIAERFWTLTKRYGWWGLAYLEAVLRLADQQASAKENDGTYSDQTQEAEINERESAEVSL